MTNTLKLLVEAHIDSGRFWIQKQLDLQGAPSWAVMNDAPAALYTGLPREDAQIICGLCNILNDPDWSSLEPYLVELLPARKLKPDGVQ
jgi:hypothetical protein